MAPYRIFSSNTVVHTLILLLTVSTYPNYSIGSGIGRYTKPENLDYVSLTDHNDRHRERQKYADEEEEANATTWVVGGVTECSNLPLGCSCTNQKSIFSFSPSLATSVTCACDSDKNQVVNLKSGGSSRKDYPHSPSWTWEIRNCSKVIVYQNFLQAFFGRDATLKVQFTNVKNLVLHEGAFTIPVSSSEKRIEFNNCDINTVPPKAFPSQLSLIKFTNSRIHTLSPTSIQPLTMGEIQFVNTSVVNVDTNAFSSNSEIKKLTVGRGTHFHTIHRDGIAAAVTHLNWTDCRVDTIDGSGLSGLIINLRLEGCTVSNVGSQGFFMKSWNVLELVNNTFTNMSQRALDLSLVDSTHSSTRTPPATMVGNVWNRVDVDFITTGSSENPFVHVQNNTFLEPCTCGNTFVSRLTLNGSRKWFHSKLFEASKCALGDRELGCFQAPNVTNYTTEDNNVTYITYKDLPILCSAEVYMCLREVNDVGTKLPNRLEVLAFFIGAFALFMIVSLLCTLFVYILRKKSPRKHHHHHHHNSSTVSTDLPRKEFVKSLNPDPYSNSSSSGSAGSTAPPTTVSTSASSTMPNNMTKTPSMPSRLALLEDVEMEDKGVQTLPTELSADIIEGLREKLSKSDSFWDAKETIDHLYDLIHVREQVSSSSISSPSRDVGVGVSEQSQQTPSNNPPDSLQPLVTSNPVVVVRRSPHHHSSNKVQPVDSRSPRRSLTTFAQLPVLTPSSKTVSQTMGHNNDSHIYSELGAMNKGGRGSNSNSAATSPSTPPPPLPTTAPPLLCDYIEPRDFQTHIYAELTNSPYEPTTTTFKGTPTKRNSFNFGLGQTNIIDIIPTVSSSSTATVTSSSPSSSVIPSPHKRQQQLTPTPLLNDLNSETSQKIGSPSHSQSNIEYSPTRRPLPSIPAKPIRKF